jgi:uncharacterized membrane protein
MMGLWYGMWRIDGQYWVGDVCVGCVVVQILCSYACDNECGHLDNLQKRTDRAKSEIMREGSSYKVGSHLVSRSQTTISENG